ncbi:hypothetical protein [Tateyamaria sp. syn59]|uniref:hypothetical protein n=1 Tax=Tateyamaria sp. syn59 TaxID=2576942 RepID=UPI001672179D|nr:hypothetical protein [Tateyamaria sp. syn59]
MKRFMKNLPFNSKAAKFDFIPVGDAELTSRDGHDTWLEHFNSWSAQTRSEATASTWTVESTPVFR